MATAQLHDISDLLRKKISRHVKLTALGNSRRTPEDVAVDLINASNLSYEEIAEGCCLCVQTIRNLAEGITVRPYPDTINRIFTFFEFEARLHPCKIQPAYANKPKDI